MLANTESTKERISGTKLTSLLLEATQQLHYNRFVHHRQPLNPGKKIQPSGCSMLHTITLNQGVQGSSPWRRTEVPIFEAISGVGAFSFV